VIITCFSSSSSRLTTLSARASYQKQTNSTPPRDLSAKVLAQTRGHLPQPVWAPNAVPRLRSARVAAAVASSHIAPSKAGQAGPSQSQSQSQSKELIVRPPSHIHPRPRPRPRPRASAHDEGDYNPNIKLSKKERVAQARCATPLSVPDSDPESVSSDEDEDEDKGEDEDEGEDEEKESEDEEEDEGVTHRTPPPRQLAAIRRSTPPPPEGSPFKVSTTPISRPGDLAPLVQPCTPIWTAADDEKLRTEFDPESPTRLLAKLEQSWMTRVPAAKSVLPAYACTTGHFQGPPLYVGHKRSREEEDKEERRHIIWNPWKRAKTDTKSPFDLAPAGHGLKLADFASGATPASLYSTVPAFHALLPPPNFVQSTVLPAPHQSPAITNPIQNGHPGPSNT
jgi:hypothetical protein